MAVETDIWLGDALKAWDRLAPGPGDTDAAVRAAIARLLGFDLEDEDQPPPSTNGTTPNPDIDHSLSNAPASPGIEPEQTPSSRQSFEPSPPAELQILQPIGRLPVRPPVQWDDSITPLPEKAAAVPSLPFEPLLEPGKARELCCASIALRRPGSAIDVNRLVRELARGNPPGKIPRHLRWSLRNGAQVLIDLGEGMDPFREDQHWFVRLLQQHAGAEQLTILRYLGCPSRGVRASGQPGMIPYIPPAPLTPVLVLGDLGIGVDFPAILYPEWQSWTQLLADNSCQALALVPWEPARWPMMPRALEMAYWDRSLTLGILRQRRILRP